MKRTLLASMIFAFAVSAFAADSKAESKNVSYKSGDETVQGVLYTPAGKGPFPAIVVIHEWWGLNDWVKEQASRLAGEGYVALAVDLYRGKVATTPEMAHEIMRGVPEDRARRDLRAAVSFLSAQPNVSKDRIASMAGAWAEAILSMWRSKNLRSRPPSSTTDTLPPKPLNSRKFTRPSWDCLADRTAALPPATCTNLKQR